MKGMKCVARRGENIYKRKDGRWEGRYIRGRRLNNQIYYGYVYAKTFHDVREKLAEKKRLYKNSPLSSNEMNGTVSQWIETWLSEELTFQVKPSTYSSYRYKLKKYVLPYLGELPVKKITKQTIQQLINQLTEAGLSVTTIRTSIQIFKRAFIRTDEVNHLYATVFHGLHYPFSIKKKIRALSKKEQMQLEQEAENTENGLPALLALHTGLRIGEISALKWTDINFEKKELTVTRTLQRIFSKNHSSKTEICEGMVKSAASYRIIPLNNKILTLLKKQKSKQTSDYVVGKTGHFFEPRTLTYQFKKITCALNLQNIHFHQLRHTFATRLLEMGADIASVSSLLGHQSVKMTLDIYIDSLMAQRKKWINKLA
jgi:integrase